MNDHKTSGMTGPGAFHTTRWTLVMRARGEAPEARAALGDLCEAYWMPVYRFLKREGRDDDQSRELTQEFFSQLLERGNIDKADPRKVAIHRLRQKFGRPPNCVKIRKNPHESTQTRTESHDGPRWRRGWDSNLPSDDCFSMSCETANKNHTASYCANAFLMRSFSVRAMASALA